MMKNQWSIPTVCIWILLATISNVLATGRCHAQAVADHDTLLLIQFDHGCRADFAMGSPEAVQAGPLVAGRFGKAVDLSDGHSVSYVGNDGNFNPDSGTIEFWIKPYWAGNTDEHHAVFSCAFGTRGYININTLGKGRFGIAISAGEGDRWKWRRADGNISDWKANSWHHVACSWGDGTISIFVDGRLGGTVTDARMPQAVPEMLRFNAADAALDCVRILRRAFTVGDARKSIATAIGPIPYRFLDELQSTSGSTFVADSRTRLGNIRIPLVLGKARYAHMIGIPHGSKVVFHLNGDYATLHTLLGVDQFSPTAARCMFRVLGDDELLFETPAISAAAAPLACDVSVRGMRKLAVECQVVGSTDHQTLGVMARAVVARAGAQPVLMSPRTMKPERIAMYRRQMRADQYAGTLPMGRPCYVVAKYWEDEIDSRQLPAIGSKPPQLSALAAAGEYQPVNFVIYARDDLSDVTVSTTDLKRAAAHIDAANIDVRIVLRGLMRDIYSRPAEQSTVVSRFLLPSRPIDVPAGTLREYQLTVHVPPGTPPGTYHGSVRISLAGRSMVTMPLAVEVSTVKLRPLKDRAYGVYYRFPSRNGDWSRVRQELRDIRAHGGTMLFPHVAIEYARDGNRIKSTDQRVKRALDMMQSLGFHGSIPIDTGLAALAKLTHYDPASGAADSAAGRRFHAAAAAGLKRLNGLRDTYAPFEILATHMDEVLGRGRLPTYIALSRLVRQYTRLRLYITIHNSPRPGVEEMTRKIDPYVDVRCYNGHAMDDWIRAGHAFAQLKRQLDQSADEAWIYYNIRGSFFRPEWTRLVNGFYLWVSPLRVHMPWMYYSVSGNPLDDTDGTHHDFVYAVPDPTDPTRMISTRHWEAFRQGVDDMRYLRTLESLVAQHAGTAQAEAADRWLASLRRRLAFTAAQLQQIKKESPILILWSQRFRGQDFRRFRREATRHILALQGLP